MKGGPELGNLASNLILDPSNRVVLNVDVVTSAPWVALVRFLVGAINQATDFDDTSFEIGVDLLKRSAPAISELVDHLNEDTVSAFETRVANIGEVLAGSILPVIDELFDDRGSPSFAARIGKQLFVAEGFPCSRG